MWLLVPFRDIIILALMIARVGTILQLGWYEPMFSVRIIEASRMTTDQTTNRD